ncbi:MAG: hypothetical protein JXB50_00985 [Spirochaetes bacterium]|nr:hypothetical protein [Spirochaetota bacterium]
MRKLIVFLLIVLLAGAVILTPSLYSQENDNDERGENYDVDIDTDDDVDPAPYEPMLEDDRDNFGHDGE